MTGILEKKVIVISGVGPGLGTTLAHRCAKDGAELVLAARTVERLSEANGRQLYERHVIPGYGHIDCIFGKNAARDIFPLVVAHLDKTAVI